MLLRRYSLRKRMIMISWLFVLPVLLVRALTTLYPIISVFYYSALDYDLINRTKEFNGFIHFPNLLKDITVQQALMFTFEYAIYCMLGIVILGTGLGLLLKFDFRGRKFLRTTVLIPWGMPMIIACMAGRWIFNDTYSIINDMVRRLFNPDFHYAWIAEPVGAKAAAIMLNIWKNTPFFAIIMLAAFQGIPTELYESARMDGASGARILRSIMLPYVLRTMVMTAVFVGVGQLNSFDIAYAMTRGGPGSSTALLAYRIYLYAIKNLDYGSASALSVILFVITATYGAIGLRIHNRVDY